MGLQLCAVVKASPHSGRSGVCVTSSCGTRAAAVQHRAAEALGSINKAKRDIST